MVLSISVRVPLLSMPPPAWLVAALLAIVLSMTVRVAALLLKMPPPYCAELFSIVESASVRMPLLSMAPPKRPDPPETVRSRSVTVAPAPTVSAVIPAEAPALPLKTRPGASVPSIVTSPVIVSAAGRVIV